MPQTRVHHPKSIAKPSNVRRWATIQQAAEHIQVDPLTIRRLITAGKLTGHNGAGWRLLRVDLNELDALIERGE